MSRNNTKKSYKTVQRGGDDLVFCPANFDNPPIGSFEELIKNLQKFSDESSKFNTEALRLVNALATSPDVNDKTVHFLQWNVMTNNIGGEKKKLFEKIKDMNGSKVREIVTMLKTYLESLSAGTGASRTPDAGTGASGSAGAGASGTTDADRLEKLKESLEKIEGLASNIREALSQDFMKYGMNPSNIFNSTFIKNAINNNLGDDINKETLLRNLSEEQTKKIIKALNDAKEMTGGARKRGRLAKKSSKKSSKKASQRGGAGRKSSNKASKKSSKKTSKKASKKRSSKKGSKKMTGGAKRRGSKKASKKSSKRSSKKASKRSSKRSSKKMTSGANRSSKKMAGGAKRRGSNKASKKSSKRGSKTSKKSSKRRSKK